MNHQNRPWTTHNEISVLDYMASGKPRNKIIPTKAERLDRLHSWINTSFIRRFDKGVDVHACREYAHDLLERLG